MHLIFSFDQKFSKIIKFFREAAARSQSKADKLSRINWNSLIISGFTACDNRFLYHSFLSWFTFTCWLFVGRNTTLRFLWRGPSLCWSFCRSSHLREWLGRSVWPYRSSSLWYIISSFLSFSSFIHHLSFCIFLNSFSKVSHLDFNMILFLDTEGYLIFIIWALTIWVIYCLKCR